MNKTIKNGNIVINSKGYYYSFYKDEQDDLHMSKFNEYKNLITSTILDYKKVWDFSVYIDKDDTIHLINLLRNGRLVYSTFKNEEWSNDCIGNLDIKSNIYRQLSIYIMNNTIYILYAFTNLVNKNIWTLELITGIGNNWTKKRIINIATNDFLSPFSINNDSMGNIHFAYKAQEKNFSHIYYVFYSIYTQSWSKIPMKISNMPVENIYPYIFVDTKDNVHILWYSLENMDYLLQYKRLVTSGPDKYKWIEIKLPPVKNIMFPTLIYEFEDSLKITYLNDNKLEFLSSNDQGITWEKNNSLILDTETIWFVKYSSNLLNSHFLGKINECYCKIDENILCYLSDVLQEETSIKSENNKYLLKGDIESPSNIAELEEEIINIKSEIEELLVYINKIDNEILNLKDSFEKGKHISFLDKLSNLFK